MADNPPTGPASSGRGRGGRRRGRGGAPPSARTDAPRNSGDGGRGSKSQARGGKRPNDRDNKHGTDGTQDQESKPLSTTATVTTKLVAGANDGADDGEICFICASTVEHTSVSPCNHRTCHICALRLRALYKNKGCAHCRVRWPASFGGRRRRACHSSP